MRTSEYFLKQQSTRDILRTGKQVRINGLDMKNSVKKFLLAYLLQEGKDTSRASGNSFRYLSKPILTRYNSDPVNIRETDLDQLKHETAEGWGGGNLDIFSS